MRYDYRCKECGAVKEVRHSMMAIPLVRCECGAKMFRVFSAPQIQVYRFASRSFKKPDTPSNAEYHAYNAWEESGSDADHKKLLGIRGEL